MPASYPISHLFTQKKDTILSALATPSESYTDLSPKGSIDAGVRDLIDRINKLEGVVTTSSCAGRISCFLEGSNAGSSAEQNGDSARIVASDGSVQAGNMGDDAIDERSERPSTVPGGKGNGGRWLFLSHDPVHIEKDTPISRLLNLSPSSESLCQHSPSSRFVKFQFEPMILHILTASLHHAQHILTSAINAGFRESGVQSLKNLDDPKSFPMVAVRSSGLALSSLIGFLGTDGDGKDRVQSMVHESHLRLLLELGNARFKANAERIKRFETNLFEGRECPFDRWEDADERRERKRAEGLREKEKIQQENARRQKDKETSAPKHGTPLEGISSDKDLNESLLDGFDQFDI